MPRTVVGLAMPIADRPSYSTLNCLFDLFAGTPREVGLQWFGKTDAPVDAARNVLANGLKEHPEVTHLLWIDDDMVFPPDALTRLLARDVPIIGGVCHNRRHPFMPILMKRVPSGPGYAFMYDYEEHADPSGLLEVDATGGAFILVRREVYEKIEPSLNAEKHEGPYTQSGGGEDVSFCARAKAAGFSILIDTTLQIGHLGEVVVDDAFARRNRDCFSMAWQPWMATVKPAVATDDVMAMIEGSTPVAPTEASTTDAADDAAAAEAIVVRNSGLRIDGFERDDEGRRHRERYAWAGRKLGRQIKVGTVLDYGCGVGYGCKIMTRTSAEVGGGISFVGYDRDPGAIAYGRKHWWDQLTSEDVLDAAPYAAFTSFEVLEHLAATPAQTLRGLLRRAPIVVGSVPFKEPVGFNPHHLHHGLERGTFAEFGGGGYSINFFGQKWDGTIGPLDSSRDVNPIMLFVARRK